jgi:hypothetical protein
VENCCCCVVIADGKYLGYALFHKEIQVFSNLSYISIPCHSFHMWNMWKGFCGVYMEMLKPTWNRMEWIWIHIIDPYVDFVVWI